jgi:hypothetical protein
LILVDGGEGEEILLKLLIAAAGVGLLLASGLMLDSALKPALSDPPPMAWRRLLQLLVPLVGLAGGVALLWDAAVTGNISRGLSRPAVPAPGAR